MYVAYNQVLFNIQGKAGKSEDRQTRKKCVMGKKYALLDKNSIFFQVNNISIK